MSEPLEAEAMRVLIKRLRPRMKHVKDGISADVAGLLIYSLVENQAVTIELRNAAIEQLRAELGAARAEIAAMRRGPEPVDDGMSMVDMEIGLIGGWPNG